MNQQEQTIRQKLGIPDTATKVLIFEAAAHLDWDWVNTFLGYYNNGYGSYQPVKDTFATAIEFMQNNQGSTTATYYYSICEMAYLRQYLLDFPDQIGVLKGLGDQLSISGGGITSAENLLTHGEAFIRNYLTGQKWLFDTLGYTSIGQLWIPDDFGSDGQLPIVVRAMGYQGVSFWRAPIAGKFNGATPTSQTPSQILTDNGLDFIWRADDNSQVNAHWLSIGYCGGNNILGYGDTSLYWSATLQNSITNNFLDNANLSPTPYSFIPIDCDFNTPYSNLLQIVENWNACNGWGGTGDGCPGNPIPSELEGAYVVAATFEDFMELVAAYNEGSGGTTLNRLPFLPNPYYSGCYTTHPDLKQMHYAATRTLLQAESMEILLEYLAAQDPNTWGTIAANARATLASNWNDLMPSTHHDYITGTSPDNIYSEEQQPDLQTALNNAESTLSSILNSITSTIPPLDNQAGQSVVLFNGIGVPQGGPVEFTPPTGSWGSALYNGQNWPVQNLNDGNILLFIDKEFVPTSGFKTIMLSTQPPNVEPTLSATHNPEDNTYTLANSLLQAVIGVDGLISLTDLSLNGGTEVLGGNGNLVTFYQDGGNIYRFGNEIPITETITQYNPNGTCVPFQKEPYVLQQPSIELTEDGPLQKTVELSGYYEINNQQVNFTLTYSLIVDEEYLRMSTTGTAPRGYSVMMAFTFAEQTAQLTHGTAYHYETGSPRQYWTTPGHDCSSTQELMTFEATHGFVIPLDENGNRQGAIYHESTPAWAIAEGAILGCILRNVPNPNYNAAWGSDNATHSANYALRIPGTLQGPEVGGELGGPLRESLQFNNPPTAVPLPAEQNSPSLPNSMSIISTSEPKAVVTALKMGTFNESNLIVRTYQPTNQPLDVELTLDSSIATMFQSGGVVTAEETSALEIFDLNAPNLPTHGNTISVAATYALTTISVIGNWQ